MGNIEEVRARGGKVIVVATEGDEEIRRRADHLITIPEAPELDDENAAQAGFLGISLSVGMVNKI